MVPILTSGVSRVSHVPAPPVRARSAEAATFIVNYDAGFQANSAARAAFQRAVDIWASQLTSTVPIVVDASFEALPANVLGSAGAGYILRNFPGAPVTNTWYPAGLANKLAGEDRFPADSDIVARFTTEASWYFGLDGNTPSGQSDFVSVVLHEIGHGLGFSGTGSVTGVLGAYGSGSTTQSPMVYDRFVVSGSGITVLSFAMGTGSAALGAMLLGNDLRWSGSNAVAANGGVQPRLYAPTTWRQGSSYSHLDEATYAAGDPNSLMTPSINAGEAIHDPGAIGRGMLTDLGWSFGGTQTGPTNTPTSSPTPTRTPTRTPTVAAGSPTAIVTAVPTVTPCSAYPGPSQSCLPATATPTVTAGGPSRVLVPFASRDRAGS